VTSAVNYASQAFNLIIEVPGNEKNSRNDQKRHPDRKSDFQLVLGTCPTLAVTNFGD
jgi:uncharacterized short protein YbdD (DUF466 family)